MAPPTEALAASMLSPAALSVRTRFLPPVDSGADGCCFSTKVKKIRAAKLKRDFLKLQFAAQSTNLTPTTKGTNETTKEETSLNLFRVVVCVSSYSWGTVMVCQRCNY